MEISNLRMRRKNSLRKEISPSSPITFHRPGSCIRLGYCHYPWNCLLAALSGAGRHGQELDSFGLLDNTGFPCRLPGTPALWVFKEILPACTPKNSPLLQLCWDWPAADKEEGSAAVVASK